MHIPSSSTIQLSAAGRLLDITYMCYEFRTPLFPAQLLQARQSDLSVTSIPQSVNQWRHNEYSWFSHPLHFIQASHTPVVKVRLVVWRSDLTGQGDIHGWCRKVPFHFQKCTQSTSGNLPCTWSPQVCGVLLSISSSCTSLVFMFLYEPSHASREQKHRTQWSLFYLWCVLFNCITAIHSYKETRHISPAPALN